MADKDPAAETDTAAAPTKKYTWLKTFIGTLAGLFSGAIVMWLSPLLDKVVKPPKPIANFAIDHEGTTVTFQNRSTGGHTGWWDFGDGSPLEPVSSHQQVVTHTYANPGDYTAKLQVRNLLGEENERIVNLHLDTPRSEPPQILALDAYPVSAGSYAPATFRVLSKVKNAQVCIWDLDDDRPLEIVSDMLSSQDRLVTFSKPGGYVIKLAAVNGTQAVEKSEIVNVLEAPTGTLTAILNVTDEATRVETVSVPYVFMEAFPPHVQDAFHPFDKQAAARAGYQVTEAFVKGTKGPHLQDGQVPIDPSEVRGASIQNATLQMGPEHRWVRLTGELLRSDGGKRSSTPPTLELPVVLVQERRSAVHRPPIPVTTTLAMPGTAMLMLPPVPTDWVDVRRQLRLELRDGEHVVWSESQTPRNTPVTIQNRPYLLSASPVGDRIRIDLVEARPGQGPAAN
jgi:PKD repeat protein